jgi:hypothetical protein
MPRYLDSTARLTSPFNLGIVVDENRIGGVAGVQEGGLVPSFHLGKPEGIVSTVLGGKIPEVEKLRRARGELLHNYGRHELLNWSSNLLCLLLPGCGERTDTSPNISSG